MKLLAFIFIVSIMIVKIKAQPFVLNIWNGKIPGAIEFPGFREDTVRIENGKIRIAKVINPTMTVYFPDKKKSNGTTVIICPGGGYGRLSIDNEGSDIAQWLNSNGITAIILKYRLPNDTIMINKSIGPLQDLQEAVRITRRHALEWNINPDKIGVAGFSAGGHLASSLSTRFNEKIYDSDSTSARPDFAILGYPVITMNELNTHTGSRKNLLGNTPDSVHIEYFSNELHVLKNTPPTFIFQAENDRTVPVQNSIDYYTALKNKGVIAELHIYSKGGHGFGLAKNGGTESTWPESCIKWLKQIGMVK
ncbi:MAG: alpha/beta hydrolase [Ignavibacteriaceae bacterium]|nr:alpha/beta hydrolase [Ignavibacteriaceae bacterium]